MNRFADFESRVPAGSPGDNRGHLYSRSDLHRHFRINGTDLDRCDRTIQNMRALVFIEFLLSAGMRVGDKTLANRTRKVRQPALQDRCPLLFGFDFDLMMSF
jgi:hypothetical protein